MISKHTPEGIYTFVTPSSRALLGYDPEELLGRSAYEFLHPDDVATVQESHRAILEEPTTETVEYRIQRKDGRYIWFETISRTVTNDRAEKITEIIAVSREITERKQDEHLLQARLRLREFAMHHSLGDFMKKSIDEAEQLTESEIGFFHFVDEDQNTIWLQAWSSNTLQDRCSAEGHRFHYPVDEAGVWVDCIHQQHPVIHEDYASLPHRKGMPQGHAHVTRELLVPVFEDDLIVAVLGVGNKQTPYTQTDTEMVSQLAQMAWDLVRSIQSEETLRKLNQAIEQSPASVVITDVDGKIEYVNPKFTQVTGYSVEEVLGQNPRILQSDEHSQEFYKDLWDTILTGNAWSGEFRNKKKNGELYWEFASISAVKNIQGEITHFVAVKEDITERKQLEREKVRQERLAAVGQLAAGIAHDFNNVMAVISLDTDLLRMSSNLTEKQLSKLTRIQKQARHASQLIQQILDFSRSSMRDPQPLNVRILIKEMLNFIKRTIPERVKVEFTYSEDDFTALVDPTQLQQVITNLASYYQPSCECP